MNTNSHHQSATMETESQGNNEAEAKRSGFQFRIQFDNSSTVFMVLESSSMVIGGGYRVTLWSYSNHQIVEMISSMELEL